MPLLESISWHIHHLQGCFWLVVLNLLSINIFRRFISHKINAKIMFAQKKMKKVAIATRI